MKTLIGNIKGPRGAKGETGAQGIQGIKGETGIRGSRWVTGTAITGISTSDTVYSETGIADALVNDQYMNVDTGNIYRCTLGGDANTATWVFIGNIQSNPTINTLSDELGEWGNDAKAGRKTLYSVAYGANKFVAVGGTGATYYSLDGITWISGNELGSNSFQSIIYGSNKFVAVGGSDVDGDNIYYSTDGITWEANAVNTTLAAVGHGADRFVAVGETGVTYYSLDGITWNSGGIIKDTTTLRGITYGNGVFVAVSTEGHAYYSSYGYEWDVASGINKGLFGVTYGNGIFVAVGYEGNVYTSENGATWKNYKIAGLDVPLAAVTFGRGVFVAVGLNGVSCYSTNGTVWTNNGPAKTGTLFGVGYGNGKFVAVGNFGDVNHLDFQKHPQTMEEGVNTLYDIVAQEIDRLVSDIGALRTKMASCISSIGGIQSSISAHQAQIQSALTRISSIESILEENGIEGTLGEDDIGKYN